MRRELCRSGRVRKKGLFALFILSNHLGVITNSAAAVIILVVLFSILSEPIAREIVTAARLNDLPESIYPMPLIGHSLSFECSLFSQTSSPTENQPDSRSGQLTIGEK
jgi:hypothetical protein